MTAEAFREHVYATMPERAFREHVRKYAEAHHWLCYFTWRSDHSPAGYPDLTMCRLSRVIWAELKSAKGRVTPEQLAWIDALSLTGKGEVYVWRPSHWKDITEVLA